MKGGKTGESQINLFFADTKAVINIQSFLISIQSLVLFFLFFFPVLIPGYPVWNNPVLSPHSRTFLMHRFPQTIKTELTSQASLSLTLNHSE